MARCLGERAFERAPILGPFHLNGRKRVRAFRIASRDADQQLVADLDRERARRVAKYLHRQHAIHLASDVHEDGFGRDGNHGAFQRFLVRTAVVLCSNSERMSANEFSLDEFFAMTRGVFRRSRGLGNCGGFGFP